GWSRPSTPSPRRAGPRSAISNGVASDLRLWVARQPLDEFRGATVRLDLSPRRPLSRGRVQGKDRSRAFGTYRPRANVLALGVEVGDARRENRDRPSALVAELLGDLDLDGVEKLGARYL